MLSPSKRGISQDVLEYSVPSFRLIDSQLNRVRESIYEQLTTRIQLMSTQNSTVFSKYAADIERLFEYIRSHSGKMIRPGLVLLSGGCCGDITDEHIHVAAMVELIHNATLLHDDVIDNGQRRRAKPTVNSLWGNQHAVLLGDFLLSRVLEMSTELKPEAVKVIAAAAVRLCEGELRQIVQRKNWQLSETEYIEVITEKSAVLFSSSCRLGALLAEADDTQVQALADFGLNAGIAFQITDDLLDIVGDEKKTGKSPGSDLNNHKLTLAVIHLLWEANQNKKDLIINSFLEGKNSQDDKQAFIKALELSGSIEYAHNQSQAFVAKAIRSLDVLKESRAKDALIETAKFMSNRAV